MSEEILDLNEFMERVQDDKELLLELFDIFMEDFTEKRKLLQDAISTNNSDEVRGIAHSIKGASGNISAKIIREIFSDLEEKGKNNDLSGSDEILKIVDQEYEKLTVRIKEIKEEFSS